MTVELKGKPLEGQGTNPGLYILAPNLVNGKSHWLQDSRINAIWYDNKDGDWIIGPQGSIGGSKQIAFYTNEDVVSPQEATTWKYYSVALGKWINSDDILVFTFEPGA